jgi:hypothetical protein
VVERSDAGVARAVRDGFTRAASARAMLAGTFAATMLLSLPRALDARDVAVAHLTFLLTSWLAGFGQLPVTGRALEVTVDLRGLIWGLVFWSFVSGGILDRYARNRPTRGRGFFGACGAHFPAMLRLGIIALAIDAAIYQIVARLAAQRPFAHALALLLIMVISVIATYARVRLVVEDRRSAIGALLAGLRFVRRNPAAIGLYLFFAVLAAAITWMDPIVTLDPDVPSWILAGAAEIEVVLLLLLGLSLYASGIALFQARLAHASYTAAPPIEWPESPSAEAMTNLVRSAAP